MRSKCVPSKPPSWVIYGLCDSGKKRHKNMREIPCDDKSWEKNRAPHPLAQSRTCQASLLLADSPSCAPLPWGEQPAASTSWLWARDNTPWHRLSATGWRLASSLQACCALWSLLRSCLKADPLQEVSFTPIHQGKCRRGVCHSLLDKHHSSQIPSLQ